MYKLQSFQNLFSLFFAFGLSPFILFKKPKKNCPSIVRYLPRITIICVGLFVVYSFSNEIAMARNILMSYSLMTTSFYVAIVESIYFFNSYRVIWQTMCFTMDNLEVSLQIQCPIKLIRNKFRQRFTLQIILVIGGFFIKHLSCDDLNNRTMSRVQDIALTITVLYKCIHLFHAIIYIDFIKITMTCLCEKIAMVKSELNEKSNGIDGRKNVRIMRQMKLVHFKLYHIAHRVNKQFGWFLTIFPLDAVVTITHSVYFGFVFIMMTDDTLLFLRK